MTFTRNLFGSLFTPPASLGESPAARRESHNCPNNSQESNSLATVHKQQEKEYQPGLWEQVKEREQQELERGDVDRGKNREVVDGERYPTPRSLSLSTQAKGKIPAREKGHQRQVRFDIGEGSTTAAAARSIIAQETNNGENQPASDDVWACNPNLMARELILEAQNSTPNVDVATLIQQSVGEPEYSLRDIEIRDSFWKILSEIEGMTRTHFAFDLPEDEDHVALTNAFRAMTRSTVNVIGCVASGGPEGEAGWRSLFYDEEKRRALVCAIISNVLREQVFQHLFFGGTPDNIRAVAALQETYQNADGFERIKRFAAIIRSILATPIETQVQDSADSSIQASVQTPPATLTLPANFADHTNHITAAIWTHLKPIYNLQGATVPIPLIEKLHTIVARAGILSLHMRLDGHTAYHFTYLNKETFYSVTCMQSFNNVPEDNTDPGFINDSDGDAVIQICIMGGLAAYRQGGWETSASTLANPVFMEGCEGVGFRERPLTHGWVYCRMGEPRPIGGRAEGGFVEFFPGVKGTRDPYPDAESKGKRWILSF